MSAHRPSLRVSLVLMVFVPCIAAAQERAPGALVQSAGLVGVDFPVGRALAVRPAISFTRSAAEAIPTSTDRASTGVRYALAVPLFVDRDGPTRIYMAPSMSVQHTVNTNADSTTAWTFGGLVGMQHQIVERVSVFGEAGVTRSSVTAAPIRLVNIGSTTAVGMIVRFR